VVFAREGDIWQVPLAGGVEEKLLSGLGAQFPAVSRTGRRLAFNEQILNTNVWRVPLASPARSGGPAERWISSSRGQRAPAFSPDGRRIAFESTRSGFTEIWTCGFDGSDPVPLTSFGGPLTGSARWSPDGQRIAFDSRAPGQSAIYITRADGGPAQRVPTGIADSSTPTWSTDGKWLFFSGLVHGTNQIFKVRPEGGASIQLTRAGGSRPRESADGRRVFYVEGGLEKGPTGIRSVSVEGGDEKPVTGVPARPDSVAEDWAVTSFGIYFVNGEPTKAGVDLFDFTTQKVRRVFDITGVAESWGGGLAVSPDGRTLLYTQLDGTSGDIMLVEGFN
jgi:Tol biopolymer transport system component